MISNKQYVKFIEVKFWRYSLEACVREIFDKMIKAKKKFKNSQQFQFYRSKMKGRSVLSAANSVFRFNAFFKLKRKKNTKAYAF